MENSNQQATALERLGTLYRDADGHEVWRIADGAGGVYADGIASDYDAAWLADRAERDAHAALGDPRQQRLSGLERTANYGDTPAIRAAAADALRAARAEAAL